MSYNCPPGRGCRSSFASKLPISVPRNAKRSLLRMSTSPAKTVHHIENIPRPRAVWTINSLTSWLSWLSRHFLAVWASCHASTRRSHRRSVFEGLLAGWRCPGTRSSPARLSVACALTRRDCVRVGLGLTSPAFTYSNARSVLSVSGQKYFASLTRVRPLQELQLTQANKKLFQTF